MKVLYPTGLITESDLNPRRQAMLRREVEKNPEVRALRFISVLMFEALLDRGITPWMMRLYRLTRVSSMEDVPDYVNWLRSALGAVRFDPERQLYVRV